MAAAVALEHVDLIGTRSREGAGGHGRVRERPRIWPEDERAGRAVDQPVELATSASVATRTSARPVLSPPAGRGSGGVGSTPIAACAGGLRSTVKAIGPTLEPASAYDCA